MLNIFYLLLRKDRVDAIKILIFSPKVTLEPNTSRPYPLNSFLETTCVLLAPNVELQFVLFKTYIPLENRSINSKYKYKMVLKLRSLEIKHFL